MTTSIFDGFVIARSDGAVTGTAPVSLRLVFQGNGATVSIAGDTDAIVLTGTGLLSAGMMGSTIFMDATIPAPGLMSEGMIGSTILFDPTVPTPTVAVPSFSLDRLNEVAATGSADPLTAEIATPLEGGTAYPDIGTLGLMSAGMTGSGFLYELPGELGLMSAGLSGSGYLFEPPPEAGTIQANSVTEHYKLFVWDDDGETRAANVIELRDGDVSAFVALSGDPLPQFETAAQADTYIGETEKNAAESQDPDFFGLDPAIFGLDVMRMGLDPKASNALARLDASDIVTGTDQGERVELGAGSDLMWAEGGRDKVFGDGGRDAISGGAGRDTIKGGAGADVLAGNGGRDKVEGGKGKDMLSGDAGADTIKGGGGQDILLGGAGNDSFVGGAGADRFVFDGAQADGASLGRDRIADFVPGTDVLYFGDGFDPGQITLRAVQAGTRIDHPLGQILLEDVSREDMSFDDLVFPELV